MLTSGSNWSVELALPDGLLGGWNQDAGLAVVHYTIPVLGTWPSGLPVNAGTSAFAAVGPGTLPVTPNAAPVAHAGADRVLSMESGEAVVLDGVLRDSLGWTGTPGACTTTTPLKFGKYDTLNSFLGSHLSAVIPPQAQHGHGRSRPGMTGAGPASGAGNSVCHRPRTAPL